MVSQSENVWLPILPLVIDHWRYFAGVIRAEEGSVAEISNSEYSYHIPEPLGVVGQIIPWNFPLLWLHGNWHQH